MLYATLPRRIKASIIDGMVLLTLMILSPVGISALLGRDTGANAVFMYMPPLLLEPLLISFFGATLGQYIFGIQVLRVDSGVKCPLAASFVRYFIKSFLGLFSMLYMLFSKKHQAIHDHVANTVVVLSRKKIERDPDFASYGESEQDLEADTAYHYPSVIRRFSFFCLWAVAAGIFVGMAAEILALLFIPSYTMETEKLPQQIEVIINVIVCILFVALAVLAAKGCLPGARRKEKG